MDHFIRRTLALLVVVLAGLSAGIASGDAVPDLVMQLTNFPDLPWTSYSYAARFRSDGLLFLWDGAQVWRQNGVNVDGFTSIGQIPGNMADAGPIVFSRDETQILLGNGAGGMGPDMGEPWHAGRIFAMPSAGASVTEELVDINYHFAFAALPSQSTIAGSDHKYFIDYGWEYYETDPRSQVSVLDAVTKAQQIVVVDIPGASSAIATDHDGNLFACAGYGDSRGLIKRFSLAAVDAAFATGTTLTWADGVAINPDNYDNQSGAGLFFDRRGYLFSGGTEGLTVFRPDGTSGTFDVGEGVYASLAYNSLTDQVLVMTNDRMSWDPIFKVFDAADFLPRLPGDADNDGLVNDADAATLAAHWLTGAGATWADGDFSGDGQVDDRDAAILAAHWTRGVGSEANVPEPSALVLLLSALIALRFVVCRSSFAASGRAQALRSAFFVFSFQRKGASPPVRGQPPDATRERHRTACAVPLERIERHRTACHTRRRAASTRAW